MKTLSGLLRRHLGRARGKLRDSNFALQPDYIILFQQSGRLREAIRRATCSRLSQSFFHPKRRHIAKANAARAQSPEPTAEPLSIMWACAKNTLSFVSPRPDQSFFAGGHCARYCEATDFSKRMVAFFTSGLASTPTPSVNPKVT